MSCLHHVPCPYKKVNDIIDLFKKIELALISIDQVALKIEIPFLDKHIFDMSFISFLLLWPFALFVSPPPSILE